MNTIRAVFEKGVFRPTEPVSLPELSEVELELRPLKKRKKLDKGLKAIYDVLSERYESGHTDTAARHNEHQP